MAEIPWKFVTSNDKSKGRAALDIGGIEAPPASGGDDTATLAGIISEAPAGAIVLLNPSNGPYLISAPLTWAKKLFIDCRGATLKATTSGLHEWIFVDTGGDETHITNGVFDSNNIAKTTIRFNNCDRVGVTHSKFLNKPAVAQADTGIKFNSCTKFFVTGCSFSDWGFRGATSADGTTLNRCIGISDASCANGLITDNDFDTVCRAVDVVGTGGDGLADPPHEREDPRQVVHGAQRGGDRLAQRRQVPQVADDAAPQRDRHHEQQRQPVDAVRQRMQRYFCRARRSLNMLDAQSARNCTGCG